MSKGPWGGGATTYPALARDGSRSAAKGFLVAGERTLAAEGH